MDWLSFEGKIFWILPHIFEEHKEMSRQTGTYFVI